MIPLIGHEINVKDLHFETIVIGIISSLLYLVLGSTKEGDVYFAFLIATTL
jgi:hypothetical protein